MEGNIKEKIGKLIADSIKAADLEIQTTLKERLTIEGHAKRQEGALLAQIEEVKAEAAKKARELQAKIESAEKRKKEAEEMQKDLND